MRYVILGAGAVGGTIGARLADAGHEVVLLARGEHARVMRRVGLRLATPHQVMTVRPEIVDDAGDLALRRDDVLILTTKTQDTAGLLDVVAALPVDGSDAASQLPVVCAQNGVENEWLALRRFRHVLGCCVMLPAAFLEPGRIDAQGTPRSGMLEIGRFPHGADDVTHALVTDLEASGFAAHAREEVMPWKYTKLLANTANALEALVGLDLSADDQARVDELAERARSEGEQCLLAAGIPFVAAADWAANRGEQVEIGAVEGRDRSGGSSWQSLRRNAGSIETDALNGEVVLLGRLHGVRTPVNEVLQRMAAAVARRGGAAGSVSVHEVADAVERSAVH